MQQRIIWFSLFLIALSITFYFFVIDDQRTARMGDLENSDMSLSGDVNSTLEVHSRLEKKWIGTSKHVQTLQEETAEHYAAYAAKMDSISDQFLIMDNKINRVEEDMIRGMKDLKKQITNQEDLFKSFQRQTNRKIDDLFLDVSTIKDDLDKVGSDLKEVLELPFIIKEIEEAREKAAKEAAKEAAKNN